MRVWYLQAAARCHRGSLVKLLKWHRWGDDRAGEGRPEGGCSGLSGSQALDTEEGRGSVFLHVALLALCKASQ